MSREIKFRAWSKSLNKMWYNVLVGGFKDTVTSVWDEERGEWVSFADCSTEMQYAGLEDNNGKEVYEGDILQHITGKIYKCFWGSFGFQFSGTVINTTVAWNCKVIGNIYENPELIEKSN